MHPYETGVMLNDISETMFTTLEARAVDASRQNSLLMDLWAIDLMNCLGRPFTGRSYEAMSMASIVLRSCRIDSWVTEFLDENSAVTVLQLACGLDSRSLRLSWGPRTRWIDVDLPEVVALREAYLPNPAADGRDYQLIAASVTDAEWLDNITTDRPTLVIMEGLVMYLETADIATLLHRICGRFSRGQIIFDTVGSFYTRFNIINTPFTKMGTLMRSTSDDGTEFEAVSPSLKLINRVRYWEHSECLTYPVYMRLWFWVCSLLPGIRGLSYTLRYDFDDAGE